MTADNLIKILEKAGFSVREGSRHTKLSHPDGRVTVIHRHKGDIPTGTLAAIARETGINLIEAAHHSGHRMHSAPAFQ